MVQIKLLILITSNSGVKTAELTRFWLNNEPSHRDVPSAYQDMVTFHQELLGKSEVIHKIANYNKQATVQLAISNELAARYEEMDFDNYSSPSNPSPEPLITTRSSVPIVSTGSSGSSSSVSRVCPAANPTTDLMYTLLKELVEQNRMLMMQNQVYERNTQSVPQPPLLQPQPPPVQLELPKYSHIKQDARQFIKKFNRICSIVGFIEDDVKVSVLWTCLTPGSAPYNWYTMCMKRGTNETWQDWEDSFIRAFTPNQIKLFRDALNYRYVGGDLSEYYYEKYRLVSRAFPGAQDQIKITLIIDGVPKSMQNELGRINFANTAELGQALMKLRPIGGRRDHSFQKPKPSKTHTLYSSLTLLQDLGCHVLCPSC